MKVLFITNYPSPYRVMFFNELGKYCDLTVIFDEDMDKQKHRHKDWFIENFEHFKYFTLNHNYILNITKIKNHLINNKYDIIVVANYSSINGIIAIYYLRKYKIPFSIEADGAFIKSGKGFKERLKKNLISSANWYFSSGKITDNYFRFYGNNDAKIFRFRFTSLLKNEIIESPISHKEKNMLRNKLGIKEKKIVLSVGRFIYQKGFDVLIKASKELGENIGVLIVGGKPTEEYIKLVEQFNVTNIYFIDFKQKKDLIKYYLVSDLFVLPTRGDIWGLVINEAMSFGLPVITTNKCIAGLELIENDKNGYIVPTDDYKALAIKIKKILEDDCLRNEMSIANILKIKEYTIENMVTDHINAFKKICNER